MLHFKDGGGKPERGVVHSWKMYLSRGNDTSVKERVVLAVVEYRGGGWQLGDDGETGHENILIGWTGMDRERQKIIVLRNH